jgi:hypothetical protein
MNDSEEMLRMCIEIVEDYHSVPDIFIGGPLFNISDGSLLGICDNDDDMEDGDMEDDAPKPTSSAHAKLVEDYVQTLTDAIRYPDNESVKINQDELISVFHSLVDRVLSACEITKRDVSVETLICVLKCMNEHFIY